jgi:hypothetical protein
MAEGICGGDKHSLRRKKGARNRQNGRKKRKMTAKEEKNGVKTVHLPKFRYFCGAKRKFQ